MHVAGAKRGKTRTGKSRLVLVTCHSIENRFIYIEKQSDKSFKRAGTKETTLEELFYQFTPLMRPPDVQNEEKVTKNSNNWRKLKQFDGKFHYSTERFSVECRK